MPFPIQFLELVVFLSVSYIGVCARAYTHVSGEDWPGFYGGNLDPNQALCVHPSSAFSRRRTWGGGRGSLSLLSSICAVRLRKKKHFCSQNRAGAQ